VALKLGEATKDLSINLPCGELLSAACIPSTQRAATPQGGALSDLARGGYADRNYVPPGERSKKSTRHRIVSAPRVHTSHRFEQYSAYPAFAFGYYFGCAY
jgi:hypothetical protein